MAEGDGSSRNFRSSYYEKLGFCGNEEKNILDLLLTSSSFDSEKLSDLCERFDLNRRCVDTWRVILGVDCGRRNPFDDYENVRRVRAEHFQSLRHHLEILLRHNSVMKKRLNQCSNTENRISNQNENHNHQSSMRHDDLSENNFVKNENSNSDIEDVTTHIQRNNDYDLAKINKDERITTDSLVENPGGKSAEMVTLMYLLEAGRLNSLDIDTQLNSPHCRKLSAMASFFVNVSNDLQEAFFLFRNFTRKLEENEALGEINTINSK